LLLLLLLLLLAPPLPPPPPPLRRGRLVARPQRHRAQLAPPQVPAPLERHVAQVGRLAA
jgi:hypothetical protein